MPVFPDIETSQLICYQLTGFYMRATLASNWLIKSYADVDLVEIASSLYLCHLTHFVPVFPIYSQYFQYSNIPQQQNSGKY